MLEYPRNILVCVAAIVLVSLFFFMGWMCVRVKLHTHTQSRFSSAHRIPEMEEWLISLSDPDAASFLSQTIQAGPQKKKNNKKIYDDNVKNKER